MKIIREPAVYLIGRQVIDDQELDKFLSDHGVSWHTDTEVAAEEICETAGRVCYMSFAKPRPGGNEAYLQHIKESGHGSVLEHAVFNLLFTGVSRTLTHELVRHRAGMGYSQLSQRYVDESVAEYVEPDIIAQDDELHPVWVAAVNHLHETYKFLADKLMEKLKSAHTEKQEGNPNLGQKYVKMTPEGMTAMRKEARQAARSVLPNATETKIFVTANVRALRHFLEMRGSRFAEPEIRKLAIKVLKVMQVEAPNLFRDYEVKDLGSGVEEICTPYRKV